LTLTTKKESLYNIIVFPYLDFMDCDYCKNEIAPAKVRKSTSGNFDIMKDTIALPFKCRRCGGSFCAKHRLPENHDCAGLKPPLRIDFTDIELENIIESEHDEKTESYIQPNINRSQESEFINCDICGKKEKIHKRSISRTVGVNVNFKHSDPENIQYTCIYCGNEYCYDHIQPDYHYCSYSIWNPEETKRKRKLRKIKLVIILLGLLFLFIYYFINISPFFE